MIKKQQEFMMFFGQHFEFYLEFFDTKLVFSLFLTLIMNIGSEAPSLKVSLRDNHAH